MQSRHFNNAILSIVFATSMISSVALAQRPPQHGGGGQPPRYNPCQVPTDPTCRGGGNGGGHNPPHQQPPRQQPPRHQPPRNDYPTYPTYPPSYPTYPPSYPTYPPSYPTYPPSYPTYPSQPTYPNYGDTTERVIYLNRSIMNQSINLRDLAGLDSQYAGYRIVSVTANTTPNSSARTVAQLIVDGVVFDSQLNPGHLISLYPQDEVRLNRTATRVTLAISGSTYIQDIRIELSRY